MAAPVSEADPLVPLRILAASGEVVLEASPPGSQSVATLLQTLKGEASTGRLSLLRGTELIPVDARLGELDLAEDESLYLVRKVMGTYTPLASGDTEEDDLLVKCILVGGSRSGKSSLLQAVSSGDFNPAYTPTIGVEFSSLRYQSEEGRVLKLQVWDTSGMDRYKAIVNAYYRGSKGLIAIFSLASRESFQETLRIVREAQGQYPESCRCICLAGTHADLPELEVTEEEALQVAAENQWPYIAVSCKTGEKVHEPFFVWMDMFMDRVWQHRETAD
ncbi:rab1 [Symbiodinium sp. CCMP2592]|nr:rab1 [Symbiodinium sp. CCMP2592]